MSKRHTGLFFRDRKKKIDAEKKKLAKQWEKTKKNWIKCETVENKSVILNEPLPGLSNNIITQYDSTIVSETLASCNSNLDEKFIDDDSLNVEVNEKNTANYLDF